MSIREWHTRSLVIADSNKFLKSRSAGSPDTRAPVFTERAGPMQLLGSVKFFRYFYFYCLDIVKSYFLAYLIRLYTLMPSGRMEKKLRGTDFSMTIFSTFTNLIIWHIIMSKIVATIGENKKLNFIQESRLLPPNQSQEVTSYDRPAYKSCLRGKHTKAAFQMHASNCCY